MALLASILCLAVAAPAWAARAEKASKYDDVRGLLQRLAGQYPENARLFTLGTSDSGQPIEGLILGNGPIENLVVATHHGNEYGSTEVAKALAESLAQDPIDGQTLYVIPVLNIDGYNRGIRWERLNGRNIDPNRNYPGPCGTEGPFTLKSTRALANFIASRPIVASATLHTSAPAVLYPWGFSTRDLSTPYDSLFMQLGEAAARESRYPVGNSAELLYPADGTYEDYAFLSHGIWSLLFELGTSHNPSPREVKKMVEANVPGLRRMFELAPTTRAEKHQFTGRCDASLRGLDRHDE